MTMKCDLIFYLAKKTALCEKKIKELFANTIYQLNSVTASTTPDSLGMQLTDALNCVNLIFVVGGLRDNDVRAISNVLSKALANSSTNINIIVSTSKLCTICCNEFSINLVYKNLTGDGNTSGLNKGLTPFFNFFIAYYF